MDNEIIIDGVKYVPKMGQVSNDRVVYYIADDVINVNPHLSYAQLTEQYDFITTDGEYDYYKEADSYDDNELVYFVKHNKGIYDDC